MNQQLQTILDIVQQNENLTAEEKTALIKAVKKADSDLTISEFKLERTERVKRTTGILLEETISELEQKRKAVEAQNRELEIEAALERVRSRSMAMQSTSELQEVIETVHKEFNSLNIAITGGVFIAINEDIKKEIKCWGAGGTTNYIECVNIPFLNSPIYTRVIKKIQKGPGFFTEEFSNSQKKKFFEHLFNHPPYSNTTKKHKDEIFNREGGYTRSCAVSENTSIFMINHHGEKFSETDNEILRRFAKVFEQTYTRFLDLQKAEAQTREAQIEAAMERIRSRAIAMRSSDELLEVALEIRIQTELLGQQELEASAVHLYEKDATFFESIAAIRAPDDAGGITTHSTKFPVDATPETKQMMKNYWAGLSQYTIELNQKQREEWEKILEQHLPELFSVRLQFENDAKTTDKKEYWNFADFSGGSLLTVTYAPPTSDTIELFRKSADVFDLAYKRYKDLQKAEAQAREAQIESALERVRSRSLAMRQSEELLDVITEIFLQLEVLEITLDSCFINIYKDKNPKDITAYIAAGGRTYEDAVFVPFIKNPMFTKLLEARENNQNFYSLLMDKKHIVPWWKQFFSNAANIEIPRKRKNLIAKSPGIATSVSLGKYASIHVLRYVPTPYSDEENQVIMRFGKAFDQVYTRFLDLQKAESQTREAQIEAALERVRSRTMAMHKSDELLDAADIFSKELIGLDIPHFQSGFVLINEEGKKQVAWMGVPGDGTKQKFNLPIKGDTILKKRYESWKKGESIFHQIVNGKQLGRHLEYVAQYFDNEEVVELSNFLSDPVIFYCGNFNEGYLHILSEILLNEEQESILARFTKAFQQTYTRFLDLKKAEAQTREAQIETALERVRARSLAMRNSNELAEVAYILFEQLKQLGTVLRWCWFSIFDDDLKGINSWYTDVDGAFNPTPIHQNFRDFKDVKAVYVAWKAGEELYFNEIKGKALKIYVEELGENLEFKKGPTFLTFKKNLSGCLYQTHAIFKHGYVGYSSFAPRKKENLAYFPRFARVFEQVYTRFLDLQKAEEQAREAQIEAALERVRSRSMAMHKSEELLDTATIFSKELIGLDIAHFMSGFVLVNEESKKQEAWMGVPGKERHPMFILPLKGDIVLKKRYEAWKNGVPIFSQQVAGKKLAKHMEYVLQHFGSEEAVEIGSRIPDPVFFYCGNFKEGYLHILSEVLLNEEEASILVRFTKAFQQTYTRFLDLLKAEAQTREAQIEASLERVRAKAMAMHSSEDLTDTVFQLFKEFDTLEMNLLRCGVGRVYKSKDSDIYAYTRDDKGVPVPILGHIILGGHPVLDTCFTKWQKGEDYHEILEGDVLKSYYKTISPNFKLPISYKNAKHFAYYFMFPVGTLYAFTKTPLSESELHVLRRFKTVVALTYRRYIDIQEAEKRARDATKQSSLDRVRGEIASMRSTKDLQRITPLIWQELLALKIPFIRCGMFIMDETNEMVNAFLSSADGRLLAQLSLPFGFHKLLIEALEQWKQQKMYLTHWSKQEFLEFMKSAMAEGQIISAEKYQDASAPPESLYLHFVSFEQGMLYVGNTESLNEEALDSIQVLANSFSVAYARYEDFKQLEDTLMELKITQTQLIQSEKMASLGELTAGIAHEIQNPLNFVNNFSEVSKELIEEMLEEMQKGDVEEVKALVEDIIQNLEKIHHHGQRADGIVKGMLQHSRASSGIKELTDINVLADEYLRLAYHGLRAKDKSFNATMKTDFDTSVGKLSVVPQDMGRVILNLLTNAFYVVHQKKQEQIEGYDPTVSISTKKNKDTIEIKVTDNGNGMPDAVKEKIFQPFFTTKPTGQGTGLGLSLSYDIITKGHGGEIEVETKEGEGTTFIITLPV